MLNSFTNFLHALALGVYASLVYVGLHVGNTLYTPAIFATFFLLFLLKVLGVAVHLPSVERNIPVRNALWVFIALGVPLLALVTLYALHVSLIIVALGVGVALVSVGVFLYVLRTRVQYVPLALSMALVYLLAALLTCGLLRVGFLLVVFSNLVWLALARVSYLEQNKYHNDIYHVMLIVSTYVLYYSVELGLWQEGACTL